MADLPTSVLLPLFDRLVSPGREAERSATPHDVLRRSIQQALQRLLSCRSTLSFDTYLASADTALDYGIPDSGSLTMASVRDRTVLARAIERAIAVFEPRLRHVAVTLMPASQNGVDALVLIDGTLPGAKTTDRARFAMTAGGLPASRSSAAVPVSPPRVLQNGASPHA